MDCPNVNAKKEGVIFILAVVLLPPPYHEVMCVSKYGKGHNISVTRLRYLANYNALNSCPIRAHLTFQNDELFKNRRVSERWTREEQQ